LICATCERYYFCSEMCYSVTTHECADNRGADLDWETDFLLMVTLRTMYNDGGLHPLEFKRLWRCMWRCQADCPYANPNKKYALVGSDKVIRHRIIPLGRDMFTPEMMRQLRSLQNRHRVKRPDTQ
jgi:hypothetical protein